MKLSRWALLVAAVPLAAGCSLGKAINAHKDEVASAAGKELKVDEAATMLAANPQLPATPDLVREVAERWVDYTLLATAYAEDTSLAVLDLDKLTQQQRDQMVVSRLFQSAVKVDTAYTDAALEQAWQTQGGGVQVHARHILLRAPENATPAQRDSVHRLAESIRQQAAGGADFAALARQYSEDPGSKAQGGELPVFGRGQMTPAFEDAAFKLDSGQISPVVETPFGYHVIKSEGKHQEALGERKEQFRQFLVQNGQRQATQKFVDSLKTSANIKVESGAAAQVKDMAKNPGKQVRGRAAERTLATFRGGQVTAGDLQQLMAGAPPEALQQLASAPDSTVEGILKDQATQRLLLTEARRRNLGLTQQETADLREQARGALHQLLAVTGIQGFHAPKGTAGNTVIEQQVREWLQQAVTGQRQLPPLGALGVQLRSIYGYNVNDAAFQRVVDKIKQIRATQPQVPQPGPQMPGAQVPGAQQQGPMPQQGAPMPQQGAPAPAPAPAPADTNKK